MLQRLNGAWHERALQVFMVIVLGHWTEHILQAWQIYYLGMPVAHAHGALGHFYPWLVQSEVLLYGYALVMLVGLWILRKGFTGTSRKWWTIALVIQFWHHIEHGLLITQATAHHNFFGSPAPVSLLQLVFSRAARPLFSTAVVSIPMVIGMYYHMFPPETETQPAACTCAWHLSKATAGAA